MQPIEKIVADVAVFLGKPLDVSCVMTLLQLEVLKVMTPSSTFQTDVQTYLFQENVDHQLFMALIEEDLTEFIDGFIMYINERALYDQN